MEQTLHINFAQFNSLIALVDYFNTEAKCKAAIAQERWGDGEAVCPYCGCTHTYACKDGRYSCPNCKRKFNVTVGTIFENTKLSLRKWFMAMYLVSSTKKGVSSHQLARDLAVTQKTAWFILHKVRGLYGITDEIELDGEVEMDEMYLGGREANKHESKKTEGTQGRSTKTKTPIFGMIQRNGNIVAMKVDNTQGATLMPIVSQFVENGATTYTDEANIYNSLTKNGYEHLFVNHSQREYVRANDIHTNGIEGF
jgi:transposase-like protein